jgi:hypothetical protein
MTEETFNEAIKIKEKLERYERTKSEISFLLRERRSVELATMSIDCEISKLMWEIGIKEYNKMIDDLKKSLEAL